MYSITEVVAGDNSWNIKSCSNRNLVVIPKLTVGGFITAWTVDIVDSVGTYVMTMGTLTGKIIGEKVIYTDNLGWSKDFDDMESAIDALDGAIPLVNAVKLH